MSEKNRVREEARIRTREKEGEWRGREKEGGKEDIEGWREEVGLYQVVHTIADKTWVMSPLRDLCETDIGSR